MIERVLSNMTVQSVVKLTTMLAFSLFTAYQIYMAIQIETNRITRLIGVFLYLIIPVASLFTFSYSPRLQKKVRSILMIISLMLLFIVRLINIPALIQSLKILDLPTALNFSAYVLPQLGTIILTVMWFIWRRPYVKYKSIAPLIPVAIAIYVLCFASECVMMIRYRLNVEGSLKLALLSRLFYFLGFSGIACTFFFNDPMMNAPMINYPIRDPINPLDPKINS